MKKLALITGASSGIGLELAKVFAENGFDLIINSGSSKIKDAASELMSYNVDITPVEADLATQDGVDMLYEAIVKKGQLDVAVLNAGIGVGGVFTSTDFSEELNMMNLNIVYTVALAKKVLKDMVLRNEGRILFTSSIAGEAPGPFYAVYAASKAFVQSFAEALRFEVKDAKKNITITSLQPGATDTDFFRRAHMENTKAGEGKKDDPAQVARQGFDALMAGKDQVVAGAFKNKVQAMASKLLSDQQGAGAQGSSTRPH